MTRPKAYSPAMGCMYQLLLKTEYCREWEHLDYATSRADLKYLLTEYGMVYRNIAASIKSIKLPKKYWSEK